MKCMNASRVVGLGKKYYFGEMAGSGRVDPLSDAALLSLHSDRQIGGESFEISDKMYFGGNESSHLHPSIARTYRPDLSWLPEPPDRFGPYCHCVSGDSFPDP